MNFRADINGLRAYAVMLVVLYHVGINVFSGGFLGVDVFFVISGYLMTGIILQGIKDQQFSLLSFYAARCRRIIPPLAVMCAALLMIGYFLIPPQEYQGLARHVVASLAFISNIIYFKHAGYFDAGAIYRWLLHTWSLSVEWQFYLLLPLVMMFTARFLRRQFAWVLASGALLSFALALVMANMNASASYFLLPTRAWEMLVGGLLFLAPKTALSGQRWVASVGAAGLIFSAMWITADDAWPGVMTLIPVALTALMIHAGASHSRLFNHRFAQALGKWSYSIYLWHWPLWVFWHLAGWPVNGITQLVLIGLSVFAGWASFTLVEGKSGKWRSRTFVTLGSSAVVLCLGVVVAMKAGLPARAPQNVAAINEYAEQRFSAANGCFSLDGKVSPQCVFGSASRVNLVVIGDSHANAMLSSVVASANQQSDAVVFIAQSSCPTIPDINRRTRPDCGVFVKNALTAISEKYPNASVLIINRFSLYLHGETGSVKGQPEYTFANHDSSLAAFHQHFGAAVKALATQHKVFIMTPVPEFDYDVIYRMSREAMRGNALPIELPRAEYDARNQDALAMLNSIVAQTPNVTLLDAAQALCDSRFCYGARDNLPLYRDSNHLSEHGNKALSEVFSGMWKAINRS